MDLTGVTERMAEAIAVAGSPDASPSELRAALTATTQVQSFVASVRADLVRALGARPAAFPEQDIAESSQCSLGEATKEKERADTLGAAAAMANALADGDITAGHIDALTRNGKKLDEADRDALLSLDTELAAEAASRTIADFDAWLKKKAASLDQADPEERLVQQRRATRLRHWTGADGMWNLRGAFDPKTGSDLARLIDGGAAAIRGVGVPDGGPSDPGERDQWLKGIALAGLLGVNPGGLLDAMPAAAAADAASSSGGRSSGGRSSGGRSRAGSAAGANDRGRGGSVGADGGHGRSTPGTLPGLGDERSCVEDEGDRVGDEVGEPRGLAPVIPLVPITRPGAPLVVIDATQTNGAGGPVLDWGYPVELPPSILAELAGTTDPDVVIVANGVVLHAPGRLNQGRNSRIANRAQRRALAGLYSTCAVPGCSVHYDRCRLHHVVFWNDGGLTDLDNLLPVCQHHHTRLHDEGWKVSLGANRELTIRFPGGKVLTTGPPRRGAA